MVELTLEDRYRLTKLSNNPFYYLEMEPEVTGKLVNLPVVGERLNLRMDNYKFRSTSPVKAITIVKDVYIIETTNSVYALTSYVS